MKNDEKYFKSLLERFDKYVELYQSSSTTEELSRWRNILSAIDLEYNVSMFAQLLEQEEYIKNENEVNSIIRLIFSDVITQFTKPLLEKRFNERLDYINNSIKGITIAENDILGENLSIKYTETDYLILGLTYEKISPLILFENFISFFGIYLLVDKDTYTFKYRFEKDTLAPPFDEDFKVWYKANSLFDMCKHFAKSLLPTVVQLITENIDLSNNPITIDLKKYINMDELKECDTPQKFYNYLHKLDIARLALPLHYLYFLLEYENFAILRDSNIQKRIIEELGKLNSTTEIEDRGYDYYSMRNIFIKIEDTTLI